MTQPNILELAKQGNLGAIATLINRQLQPKGITAKVGTKNSCLQIMLEANQRLNQDKSVAVVRKWLTSLQSEAINKVRVYGRRTGEDVPDWAQEFELAATNWVELAKQGDAKAINILMNQELNSQGITVKTKVNDSCLQVMLESERVPEQSIIVVLIHKWLKSLNIQSIIKVKIYGKQIDEDFPDWHQQLNLVEAEHESSLQRPVVKQNPQPSVNAVEREITESPSEPVIQPEIDVIDLSIRVYETLHEEFYQPIFTRIKTENEADDFHGVIRAFAVEEIENDLKLALGNVGEQVKLLMNSFARESGFKEKVDAAIANLSAPSALSRIISGLKKLKSVTEEVLRYKFPEESNGLVDVLKGGWEGVTFTMLGHKGQTSQEAMMGAAIGSIFAPALGSVIGGAIGNWFASNKQKEEMQKLIERYNAAHSIIMDEYNNLWAITYQSVCQLWSSQCRTALKSFQEFQDYIQQYSDHYEQAIKYKKDGQINLCVQELQSADKFFPKKESPYRLALGLRDDEEFVNILILLGEVYLAVRQLDVAENYYNKALAVDSYAVAYYGLACVFSVQNNQDRALNYLDRALANGFIDFKTLEANKDLDNIKTHSQYQALVSAAMDLASEVGVDYRRLRDLLAAEKWKDADMETWNLMCRAVGKPEGSYLEPGDIGNFSCLDLKTIDRLWMKYSAGNFGFSIQLEIYNNVKNIDFQDSVQWPLDLSEESYQKLQTKGRLPYLCHNKGRVFFMGDSQILSNIMDRARNCNVNYALSEQKI